MLTQSITINLLRAAAQSQTPRDFCSKVVHSVLGNAGCIGACLFSLGQDTNLQVLGIFGFSDLANDVTAVPLFSNHLVANACLTGQVGYSDTVKQSEPNGSNPGVEKIWSVGFRVTNAGLPAGAMQLFFSSESNQLGLPPSTIEAISVAAEPFVANRSFSITKARFSSRTSFASLGKDSAGETLSARQKELLQQMAKGFTYAAIAAEMHLSESTIKQEAGRIFRKLDVANRHEAVAKTTPATVPSAISV